MKLFPLTHTQISWFMCSQVSKLPFLNFVKLSILSKVNQSKYLIKHLCNLEQLSHIKLSASQQILLTILPNVLNNLFPWKEVSYLIFLLNIN